MLPRKILLVDDEEDFVTTLAERLSLRGIEAQTAFNAESAIEQLSTTEFDIVVMDVMMPGMGGLEALGLMKKRYPGLPVILLTGLGAMGHGKEGKALGAYDFLVKPLQLDELIDKINQALASSDQ
jgi:DNA-binding NtrC family response regulator